MTFMGVRLLAAVAATFMLLVSLAALAADAVPTEHDPVAAARAVKLSEKLRCLVCQNQSIAESNAELAVDLRRQINEQIAAGKTDEQIVSYMVARYGDFVLYQPPVKSTTLLLWLGPGLLVLLGFVVLARTLRARRRSEVAPAPELDDAERERVSRLLGDDAQKQVTPP